MDKMLVHYRPHPPPPPSTFCSASMIVCQYSGAVRSTVKVKYFSQDNKTTTQPSLKTQTAYLKVQHPKNAVLVITRSKVNIKVVTDAYVLRGKCEYTNNFHVGLTDWRLFN